MADLRQEEKDIKKVLSDKAEEVSKCEAEIMKELEDQKLDSFKGNAGLVYFSEKYDVKFPKEDGVKEELREYLEQRGAFGAMWSINYASLNSWYKQEIEHAKSEGQYLDIPGLDPVMSKTLNFRKG